MPGPLDDTIAELTDAIDKAAPEVRSRFSAFRGRFEEAFPTSNPSQRRIAEAMVYTLMRAPLFLYAFGMHGATVLELHSVIERLTLEQVVHRLARDTTSDVLESMIERHTLPDLATVLCKLDLLDERDVAYARRLSRLRNGVAHRNPRAISKAVFSGKKMSFLDIDKALERIDCCDLILKGIRYLPKLAG